MKQSVVIEAAGRGGPHASSGWAFGAQDSSRRSLRGFDSRTRLFRLSELLGIPTASNEEEGFAYAVDRYVL